MTQETQSGGNFPESTSPRMGRTALVVGLANLANYLGWLGRDQTKHLGPDGYLHGPYEPWQVVGVVLVLSVIAAVAGWRRHPKDAVIVTTLVVTVSFSITAMAGPNDDGLWPLGAIMVAVGTSLGVGLVAFVAEWVRGVKSAQQTRSGWRPPWRVSSP